MRDSRFSNLVDAYTHFARGNPRAKTVLRMVLTWLAIVVGFPTFYLVAEGAIGHLTLSAWELQHLTGPPWWQPSISGFLFLTLANTPSTVLITIASWQLTKKNAKYSFWNTFATSMAIVIPPLSGMIIALTLVFTVRAILWAWTILSAPAYLLLGLLIIGAYVAAIAIWSHLCRRFLPIASKSVETRISSI